MLKHEKGAKRSGKGNRGRGKQTCCKAPGRETGRLLLRENVPLSHSSSFVGGSAALCRVPIYQSLTRIAICSNLPMEYGESKAKSTIGGWADAGSTMYGGSHGPSGPPLPEDGRALAVSEMNGGRAPASPDLISCDPGQRSSFCDSHKMCPISNNLPSASLFKFVAMT